jgi:hypothetical protein
MIEERREKSLLPIPHMNNNGTHGDVAKGIGGV